MITVLDDGRIFEKQPILSVIYNPDEPVYKYVFRTKDRRIKASAGHSWGVWDKYTKDLDFIKTSEIQIDKHELLIQIK